MGTNHEGVNFGRRLPQTGGQFSTCVDAPVDASGFFGRLGKFGQVLSCVRPLDAARHTPRALMEMRGPGPNRLSELESSPRKAGFSRSRLVDRLPLPVLRPARIPDSYPRFAILSGGFERGSPVDLPLRRQRPDDARHPVGQRHRDKHPRLARQHPGQPGVRRLAASDRVPNDRHGACDQQPPKIALAHLRYLAQPRLAAGRVLTRYEARARQRSRGPA